MHRSAKELRGYTLSATDGEIGKVDDVLFDDARWVVRYLVVDTGGWLGGRKVLISPLSFGTVDWHEKIFNVNLTREQVKGSPDISTNQPVSSQQETAFFKYYGYFPYWDGFGLWGLGMYPTLSAPVLGAQELAAAESAAAAETDELRHKVEATPSDPHLRSAREVIGYHIHALDGELGHVADFIIDERSWAIEHMLIDTKNWLPGKHVLIAPRRIGLVSWEQRLVEVRMPRENIKSEPEFNADQLREAHP
jgi:uncharacterized protein YrrD